MPNKPLIVILGATASGKNNLALKLAQKFNGELVCADSRQVYQGLDIGTNKSEGRLVDIAKPGEEFSLADYKKIAVQTIKNIQKQGKIPFLVGGTGLYIQAIVDNLAIPKVKPNKAWRKNLEKQSLKKLFQKLKKIDPLAAKEIDAQNKRRLVRALEVCLSGQKFSQRTKEKPLFNVLQIGLGLPKETLRKRINRRVDQMLKRGLVKEVKKLAKKYSWQTQAMSGIGYQEFKDYFLGKQPLTKTIELIKLHTQQYAKRQMTWFRKDKRINWISNYKEAEKLLRKFLGQ